MGFILDKEGNYIPVFGESGGSVPADVLRNIATGTDDITILGTPTDRQNAINIGVGSAVTGNHSTVIGTNASAGGASAIAIGRNSKASANYAIQIGQGTNSTAKTMNIGFDSTQNYQLLDGETGKIPSARYENYIPAQTRYSLKSDGTGDFSTLAEFVSFLHNKWSNGFVALDIYEGTYSSADLITFDTAVFNIPLIQLKGESAANTIIQRTGTQSDQSSTYGIIRVSNPCTTFQFTDLTFKQLNGDKTIDVRGVVLLNGGIGFFTGTCNYIGTSGGITVNNGSYAYTAGTQTFTNCRIGINCAGNFQSYYGATYTFDNCGTGFGVSQGGILRLNGGVNCSFTNTTTHTSITKDTFTASGFLMSAGATGL